MIKFQLIQSHIINNLNRNENNNLDIKEEQNRSQNLRIINPRFKRNSKIEEIYRTEEGLCFHEIAYILSPTAQNCSKIKHQWRKIMQIKGATAHENNSKPN